MFLLLQFYDVDSLICRSSLDEELSALVVERLLIERTTEQDLTPPGVLFLLRLLRTLLVLSYI